MWLFRCGIHTEKGVMGNCRSRRLAVEQMFTPPKSKQHVVQPCTLNKLTFWSNFMLGDDFWNGTPRVDINMRSKISRDVQEDSHANISKRHLVCVSLSKKFEKGQQLSAWIHSSYTGLQCRLSLAKNHSWIHQNCSNNSCSIIHFPAIDAYAHYVPNNCCFATKIINTQLPAELLIFKQAKAHHGSSILSYVGVLISYVYILASKCMDVLEACAFSSTWWCECI